MKKAFLAILLVVFLFFVLNFIIIKKIYLPRQKIAETTVSFSCRTFDSNLVRFDEPSIANGYQESTVKINPQKTAIIAIDLWDNTSFLEKPIKYKINPLLDLARKNNITVIHAISGDKPPYPKIHRFVSVKEEDIFVYGYDYADDYLYRHGIDTLLYVGYDALLCVLDKPNGVFHTLTRNPNFKTILIRDAVFSGYDCIVTTAINIIESQLGCSTTTEDLFNSFHVTPPQEIFQIIKPPFAASFDLEDYNEPFIASETALVVVGLNDDTKNPYWQERIKELIQTKITNVIKTAREKGLTIIYAPGFDKKMSREIVPLPNELVVTSEKKFMQIIIENHLRNLLYVGSGLNEEILFGPAGITRIYIQARYKRNDVTRYYLVKDAVLTFETPETEKAEIIKNTLLKYYRKMKVISSEKLESLLQ